MSYVIVSYNDTVYIIESTYILKELFVTGYDGRAGDLSVVYMRYVVVIGQVTVT